MSLAVTACAARAKGEASVTLDSSAEVAGEGDGAESEPSEGAQGEEAEEQGAPANDPEAEEFLPAEQEAVEEQACEIQGASEKNKNFVRRALMIQDAQKRYDFLDKNWRANVSSQQDFDAIVCIIEDADSRDDFILKYAGGPLESALMAAEYRQ